VFSASKNVLDGCDADANNNGQYDPGETIDHSAVVHKVNENGYTTEVIGKMGQAGISINHPNAPGYYNTNAAGQTTSRAYFRSSNMNSSVLGPAIPSSVQVPDVSARQNATYVAPPAALIKR